MNIQQVLNEYDALFRKTGPEEIHAFLASHISQAEKENDRRALLTLLNEQLGYARDTDCEDVAMSCVSKLRNLLADMNLEGSMPYGNTYLNIANGLRAYGRYEEAEEAFRETEKTYTKNLPEGDYSYAGLYNNWSILAILQQKPIEAIELIRKAIDVIDRYDAAVIEQATSRVNLAQALIDASVKSSDEESLWAEAYDVLREAVEIFEKADRLDYHFAGALAALGDMQVKDGKCFDAIANYQRAVEIIRLYMGDNKTSQNIMTKITLAEEALDDNQKFYLKAIAPMIRKEFPEYEKRIAVGIAGEGSDCFGYDDAISRDHDYGIGVCLWLIDEDAEQIGDRLQNCYNKALDEWDGSQSERLAGRRGVQRIRDFYTGILGFNINLEDPVISDGAWFYTDEWRFATAANGAVYKDDLGIFNGMRDVLNGYYPERIWRMRLANRLHDFSGAMQANYARCMSRGDVVAANYCKARSLDAAIDIMHLLNHSYAPYYKWKFKSLRALEGAAKIAELLEKASLFSPDFDAWEGIKYDARIVNTRDELVLVFEEIAGLLAEKMYESGLIKSKEVYLETHCQTIGEELR